MDDGSEGPDLYEVVRVVQLDRDYIAVVTDVQYANDRYQYTVTTWSGEARTAEAEQITTLYRLEPPFEIGSQVRVSPRDPDLTHLAGIVAMVSGRSFDVKTRRWGFAVNVPDDRTWCFDPEDLEPA